MGTAAIISITSNKEGTRVLNSVIGMTADGFPHNLIDIGKRFLKTAEKLSTDGKTFDDRKFVLTVMRNVANSDGYLFVSTRSSAKFISYSAILNPFTGVLKIYEGFDEKLIKTIQLPKVDLLHNVDPNHQYHTPFHEDMRALINKVS